MGTSYKGEEAFTDLGAIKADYLKNLSYHEKLIEVHNKVGKHQSGSVLL